MIDTLVQEVKPTKIMSLLLRDRLACNQGRKTPTAVTKPDLRRVTLSGEGGGSGQTQEAVGTYSVWVLL